MGKRVVVTSSTRGIGRGVAETFLRAGAKVFIGSRNPEAVRETLESLRKISPAVWGITVDMTSLESVGRFSREARETLGGIDVLIINSGNPSNEPATFFETTMEDWIQSVNLFLLSPIKLIREMAEDMMKGKWGRIFFLSSYTVKEPKDFFSLADVSRSPLIQLTKILGRELGPFNITVNTILMGTFDSEGARDSISKLAKRRGQPSKRYGWKKLWDPFRLEE